MRFGLLYRQDFDVDFGLGPKRRLFLGGGGDCPRDTRRTERCLRRDRVWPCLSSRAEGFWDMSDRDYAVNASPDELYILSCSISCRSTTLTDLPRLQP